MMSELIKVIVADDNKVERNAICNLITKSGLPLMLADSFSNGEDALLYIEILCILFLQEGLEFF